jgi:hypothetical protein
MNLHYETDPRSFGYWGEAPRENRTSTSDFFLDPFDTIYIAREEPSCLFRGNRLG